MTNEECIDILQSIYPSQKEIVTGEYPEVAKALEHAITALRQMRMYDSDADDFGNGYSFGFADAKRQVKGELHEQM